MGEANYDASFELVEVEGVGGMAHAEEDEVRCVYCVGDLFLAEEVEVFGDLSGAGGDGYVAEDLCGEAAAELWGLRCGWGRLSLPRQLSAPTCRCAPVGMTHQLSREELTAGCRWWRLRGRCRSGSWRRRGWW